VYATIPSAKTIVFNWYISSEYHSDYFWLYVNNVATLYASGNSGWYRTTITNSISSNTIIDYCYIKDTDGFYAYNDAVYVDNLSYTTSSANPISSLNNSLKEIVTVKLQTGINDFHNMPDKKFELTQRNYGENDTRFEEYAGIIFRRMNGIIPSTTFSAPEKTIPPQP